MQHTQKIHKLLIANRSEVALRIQATARTLGIKTVVIYTAQDRSRAYVAYADEAYPLTGDGTSGYLAQEEILNIAQLAGVDALHPGYGFLSENALFAQKVVDAGILWIGPSPEVIKISGDKIEARGFLDALVIPAIPGGIIHASSLQALQEAERLAEQIGYPVMLKNPSSGGGKAMRRINSACNFQQAWQAVIRESGATHSAIRLLLEKCIDNARHLEIQIAGDGKQALHLYERNCTLQRNHQKVIEEAPSLQLSSALREKLYTYAKAIVQHLRYAAIGTIEFLITPEEDCYFLEINPRLQVEHSVTEWITGIDLVALQLHLAQKNPLPYRQEDIVSRGHALECRIYTENAFNNFLPSTGIIQTLIFPSDAFTRIDHDLSEGIEITPFFDPMIAKITTYGSNRNEARRRMIATLERTTIAGPTTNISFLLSLLNSPAFIESSYHTRSLHEPSFMRQLQVPDLENYHDDITLIAHALTSSMMAHVNEYQKPSIAQKTWWKKQSWY